MLIFADVTDARLAWINEVFDAYAGFASKHFNFLCPFTLIQSRLKHIYSIYQFNIPCLCWKA